MSTQGAGGPGGGASGGAACGGSRLPTAGMPPSRAAYGTAQSTARAPQAAWADQTSRSIGALFPSRSSAHTGLTEYVHRFWCQRDGPTRAPPPRLTVPRMWSRVRRNRGAARRGGMPRQAGAPSLIRKEVLLARGHNRAESTRCRCSVRSRAQRSTSAQRHSRTVPNRPRSGGKLSLGWAAHWRTRSRETPSRRPISAPVTNSSITPAPPLLRGRLPRLRRQ